MNRIEIAKELLKNTTNIYLKKDIENYILNIDYYITGHILKNEFYISDTVMGLDMCISYIEKENFNITNWGLFEIPIYYSYVFYNDKTIQMFDIAIFEDATVIPRYLSKGNEKNAKSIQEAIEKYDFI